MYSKWHKVDFHIHTDKSRETKSGDYTGTFDAGVLLQKLRDNGVEMFSLTDHNIINNLAYDQVTSICAPLHCFVGVELDLAIDYDQLKDYLISHQAGASCKTKSFHAVIIFESSDYQALSTILESMYTKITSDIHKDCISIDLSIDKQYRVTTFTYLLEFFNEDGFIIIAHGNKKKGACATYGKSGLEDDLLYSILLGDVSALEMKSAIKRRNAIEYINRELQRFQNNAIPSTAPMVCFSDNHDCANYSLREQSTWIKGALDYETLRLAFSDHDSRIHTSNIEPTHVSEYIDSIKIRLNGQNEQTIYLSPYLNVLIGGRSSGKSLLFNTIIRLNDSIQSTRKQVFITNYSPLLEIAALRIRINDDTQYKLSCSCLSDVYCQEDIIRLFKEDNALAERLPEYFEHFDPTVIQEMENRIDSKLSDLKWAYRSFFDKNIKAQIGECKQLLELSVMKTQQLFEINLSGIPNVDEHSLDGIVSDLKTALEGLKKLETQRICSKLLFQTEDLIQIQAVIQLINSKVDVIENWQRRQTVKRQYFDGVKRIYREYVDSSLNQKKRQIEESKRLLNAKIDGLREYFTSMIKLRLACNEITQLNVFIPDNVRETGSFRFISKASLCVTSQSIVGLFSDKIHQYDTNIGIFENMIALASVNMPNVRIKNISTDRGKFPDELNKKIDEFLSSNQARISYEIMEVGGQNMSTSSTSQGKKSSMFLDIKLNHHIENGGVSILMIDQPEDNLDNKFMSHSLIHLLRKLKKTVQIIFVTHNPSIAIFGDAENLVIADNFNGVITYQQGGLENKRIRKDACDILDGGEAAFRNRMEKYSINNIRDSEDL